MGSCNAFIKGVKVVCRMLDGYGKQLQDFDGLGVSRRQIRRFMNKMVAEGYAKIIRREGKCWWKITDHVRPTKVERFFKSCSKCITPPKEMTKFPKNRYSPDGRGNICYVCLAEQKREWVDKIGHGRYNAIQRRNYARRKKREKRKVGLHQSAIM